MRFAAVKAWTAVFLVLMLGAQLGAARAAEPWREKLNEPDQQKFMQLISAVDGWTAANDQKIRAEIQAFVAAHPDFVPAQVEAIRAKWLSVAAYMGMALASKSFFIMFEELEKLDPSYQPAYIYGARTYIYSGYPAGARKQLEKAQALDAADPWADITWSLMFERLGHREEALTWARTALPKTVGKTSAMAEAILAITKLQGASNHDAAVALADQVYALEPGMGKLTEVIHACLSGYLYQAGLLDVLTEVTQRIEAKQPPSNALLYETARLKLADGYLYDWGIRPQFRPEYAAAAIVILDKIRDDPQQAASVWQMRFRLALSLGDVAVMSQLLEEGGLKGYDVTLMGHREAQMLVVQGRYGDVMDLYHRRHLPEDNLLAMAYEMGGDHTVADRIYLRALEEDPNSGTMNATYARLRLFRDRDVDGAIKYGEKAYSLLPSPFNRSLVTIAWLVRSSDYLKVHKLKEAKEAFARAREVGMDPAYIQALCSNLCNDINLPLYEFR
ncbi:Tetratricopeptide TPR_2 repeat protein [Mesorhizobium loti]|nr:Tetratricopeptide TPR_2 repeat protein [Mesorhizobium loti]